MRILLPLTLIICLLGCDQKPAPIADPNVPDSEVPPPYVNVDTTDGSQFVTVLVGDDDKGATLSKTELQIIDSLVRLRVAEHNVSAATEQSIDLSEYKRQYFLSINTKGEKEVEVNCFCEVHDNDDWKVNRVLVQDGGACYFNLQMNVATRRVLSFRVNGEA